MAMAISYKLVFLWDSTFHKGKRARQWSLREIGRPGASSQAPEGVTALP